MTDLGMMTGKAALRLAKEESGLTRDEIAERLGVSHSVTKRYFNINDTYMPSLEMIPRLCLALGNDILMRWLEARLQGGESFSREEIEEEMVRAVHKGITLLCRLIGLIMPIIKLRIQIPLKRNRGCKLTCVLDSIRHGLKQLAKYF